MIATEKLSFAYGGNVLPQISRDHKLYVENMQLYSRLASMIQMVLVQEILKFKQRRRTDHQGEGQCDLERMVVLFLLCYHGFIPKKPATVPGKEQRTTEARTCAALNNLECFICSCLSPIKILHVDIFIISAMLLLSVFYIKYIKQTQFIFFVFIKIIPKYFMLY